MTGPTTSADRYHHGNLRQALLDKAADVLEQDGADAISFRALARALDVSHAAPGHHFADRHELLAELAADGFAALADSLTAAMDGQPPEKWPIRTGEAYIRFGTANPERYRMMFASGLLAEECPDRLTVESTRAYLLLLRATYQQESEGDPALYDVRTPELAAWSMVHGAVMLWLDHQLGSELDQAEFERLTGEMLVTHFGQPR